MSQALNADDKDVNVVAAPDTVGTIFQANENLPGSVFNKGEIVSSAGSVSTHESMDHGSNVDAANSITEEVISTHKEAPIMLCESKENAGPGNSPLDSTQVTGFDISLNGNAVGRAGDGERISITENGVGAADGVGSTALHHPPDGSGLGAEEDRLWSIVTANSLDFNAWTALVEETERMSEGNILKFRKVYDAFLAEFPLCYGYWKKYADHEARLSSMDKVAEVYERAVQGVTYSVDMWLHYCVFAIGTYGDPDTIRSCLQLRLLKCKV